MPWPSTSTSKCACRTTQAVQPVSHHCATAALACVELLRQFTCVKKYFRPRYGRPHRYQYCYCAQGGPRRVTYVIRVWKMPSTTVNPNQLPSLKSYVDCCCQHKGMKSSNIILALTRIIHKYRNIHHQGTGKACCKGVSWITIRNSADYGK